ERGPGRLPVALDRSRLAVAGDPTVADLDLDDLRDVLRSARDRERLGELEGDDPGGDLHGRTLRPGRRRVAGDRDVAPAAGRRRTYGKCGKNRPPPPATPARRGYHRALAFRANAVQQPPVTLSRSRPAAASPSSIRTGRRAPR